MEPTGGAVLEKEPITTDIGNDGEIKIPTYSPPTPQENVRSESFQPVESSTNVSIPSLGKVEEEQISSDQDLSQQKIEIKDLHNFQTEPKNLKYTIIETTSNMKVESASALDFETHPNPVDGKRLEELVKIQNP